MARETIVNRARFRAGDGPQAFVRDMQPLGLVGAFPGATLIFEHVGGANPDTEFLDWLFIGEHSDDGQNNWTTVFSFDVKGPTSTRSGPRVLKRFIRFTITPRGTTADALVTLIREE